MRATVQPLQRNWKQQEGFNNILGLLLLTAASTQSKHTTTEIQNGCWTISDCEIKKISNQQK